MFQKRLAELTINDINNLVSIRRERENLYLEYKSNLSNSNRDKKEFLKDVSGFANAGGGFLLIGIEENKGVPTNICGTGGEVGNQKIDEWINNVLISNLDPKIYYELKIITGLKDNKALIIIHIPESKKKPHMVTLDNRNNYFIRHNTSVNAATHIEVREMFEYSNRITNKLEQFLKTRNMFDENDYDFGQTDNSEHLFSRANSESSTLPPILKYSFMPRYLEDNRVDVASKEMAEWIEENSKGFNPAPHVEVIKKWNKIITLYGVTYPDILPRKDGQEVDYYYHYVELLNNGYIESGHSYYIFYNHREKKRPIIHLTYTVGLFWIMLEFALSYFKRINYFEEVIFQLSSANIKGIALGGFGKLSDREKWYEPYSWDFEKPPVCRHERFKFNESFLVKNMNDDDIVNVVKEFSKKISRAFGETCDKCFSKEGNIDEGKLNYLLR